jgi:hypothetical protein
MRGMLLIVIAVFIPPTLTYLGFLGGADTHESDLPAAESASPEAASRAERETGR